MEIQRNNSQINFENNVRELKILIFKITIKLPYKDSTVSAKSKSTDALINGSQNQPETNSQVNGQ